MSAKGIWTAVALLSIALTAAACAEDGSGSQEPPEAASPTANALRDPATRGLYNIATTTRTFIRSSTADGSERVIETLIWYPASGEELEDGSHPPADGDFPLVIFSHGSGGRPDFQAFLTEHLASWGFIVAAPPHPGNTNDDCFPCDIQNILRSARERPSDVTTVLDGMLALNDDPADALSGSIDSERTAIAGHSFGGWTGIYVAGEERFDAVVAYAPGAPDTLLQRAKQATVPVMIQAGSLDIVVQEEAVRRLWDALPDEIERTFVLFPFANHLSWVDRCFGCVDELPEARGHALINAYTTAFLMTYVAGDQRFAPYLSESPTSEVMLVPR